MVDLDGEMEEMQKNPHRPEVKRPKYTKYPPGTRLSLFNFPDYEGVEIEMAVCPTRPAYQPNADDQSDGKIRVTGQLPGREAEADLRQTFCPHCQRPFTEGIYLKPGKSRLEAWVYDQVFMGEEIFEEWLKQMKGKVLK